MTEQKKQAKRYLLGDLLGELAAVAAKKHAAYKGGRAPGPCTGLSMMDEELCGAFETGLHAVTGDAGAGKTAFALQVACNCGYPALYVSCEMPPLELSVASARG